MVLNKDFKEFVELLNLHKVEYLIVGGYAFGAHAEPRYTKDLDIWFCMTTANAEKMLAVIKNFGFGSLDINKKDFLTPGTFIQLGYPPLRIDIINEIDGVEFEKCYPNRLIVKIDGIPVYFIGKEDLKKNKKASGRLQDLADLEKLENID